MKLLTKTLEDRFKKIGRQEDKGLNAVVVAKFFTPWTGWTWYATEYDSDYQEFFGLVDGLEAEMGYFALSDLESVTGPGGLRIERDLGWTEKSMGDVMELVQKRRTQ
jgi:hypothetical protein